MTKLKYLAAAAALSLSAAGAQAATITFDGATAGPDYGYEEAGFTFDSIRIVNGNCDSASGAPCGAENKNETSTLTQIGGGLFDATSMWFQFLGAGVRMTLTTDHGSYVITEGSAYPHNTGFTLDLANLSSIFAGISFLNIKDVAIKGGNGNIRFDDITVNSLNPAPVPLPATGLMLVAGMGGLAALRRRKQTA